MNHLPANDARWHWPLLAVILAALACNTPGPAASTPASATVAPTVAAPTVEPTLSTSVANPTSLSPAGTTQAAACPAQGDARLPAQPPVFADYATTIEAFLSGGGPLVDLESTLTNWGAIGDASGALFGDGGRVISGSDLTGDGSPELIVAVQAPVSQFPDLPAPPGDLYIYGCEDSAYTLLFGDYSTPDRPVPTIIDVADLDGDGVDEVVYATYYCGAHTCVYHVYALRWSTSSLIFSDLLAGEPSAAEVPYADIHVENVDATPSLEVVVDVGGIGSAGAGPQRLTRNTYSWNGSILALSSQVITTPESEWFPIHYLMDGDAATEGADYATAISAYQHVIDDPNPKTLIDSAAEPPALKAYARYRQMVTYVLMGQVNEAEMLHDALFAEYDTDPGRPGASFATMADLFWTEFSSSNSVASACAPVVAYAEGDAESYRVLNDFGYANRYYQPVDLCPFGG